MKLISDPSLFVYRECVCPEPTCWSRAAARCVDLADNEALRCDVPYAPLPELAPLGLRFLTSFRGVRVARGFYPAFANGSLCAEVDNVVSLDSVLLLPCHRAEACNPPNASLQHRTDVLPQYEGAQYDSRFTCAPGNSPHSTGPSSIQALIARHRLRCHVAAVLALPAWLLCR